MVYKITPLSTDLPVVTIERSSGRQNSIASRRFTLRILKKVGCRNALGQKVDKT